MGAIGRLTRKIEKRNRGFNRVNRVFDAARADSRNVELEPRPITGFYAGMTEEQQLEVVTVGEIQPSHPSRYESHGLKFKGRVFNGECNRGACDNRNAVYYNAGTYSYYCPPCGQAINGASQGRGTPLCARVSENLTHERMNELAREQYA
ncbi:hypothetical protein [Pararhizobium qamdonense]|uniref:hypothetical protein n=1 Tax=Pararhizobium qamdonense TaxID=3031126 RepID=UPI0023E33F1D|nr:hypothetical protein [Pararhizobium qamdonense]